MEYESVQRGPGACPGAADDPAGPPYEAVSFQIISFAGTAKSCYLEAIEAAKAGDDPSSLIEQGDVAYRAASEAHQRALVQEVEGTLGCGLLLIQAETILISAETIRGLLPTIVELAADTRAAG